MFCVALRNRHGLLQMPRMESDVCVRGWDAFRRCDMTRSIKRRTPLFSLLRVFRFRIVSRLVTATFRRHHRAAYDDGAVQGKKISLATTPRDIPNCKDSPYFKLYSIYNHAFVYDLIARYDQYISIVFIYSSRILRCSTPWIFAMCNFKRDSISALEKII